MTVVGLDEVDVAAAKEYVENVVGADFRIRPYF
jgi:hypothetical protein